MFKKRVVFSYRRRRRQGQQTTIFLKMCGFLPRHPRRPKNYLAKKPLRDPFEVILYLHCSSEGRSLSTAFPLNYFMALHWTVAQLQGICDIYPGHTVGERAFAAGHLLLSVAVMAALVRWMLQVKAKKEHGANTARHYLEANHISKKMLQVKDKKEHGVNTARHYLEANHISKNLCLRLKSSLLLVLALGCLPGATAATTAETVALSSGEPDYMMIAVCLMVAIAAVVGGCCGWAGYRIGRWVERRTPTTRAVGIMTEQLIPVPPPPQPPVPAARPVQRRFPETVWTTRSSGTCFHAEQMCGGMSNAGSKQSWRRCFTCTGGAEP